MTIFLFEVTVNVSVTSDGTRIVIILLAVESSEREHGIFTVSSSIVNVLLTAWRESFELIFKLASWSVKRLSGKVIVIFCRDPCIRRAGYDT